MFTHARCGGVLIPIAAPEWDKTGDEYARCDRCRLPGVVEGRTARARQSHFTHAEAEEIRDIYWHSKNSTTDLAAVYNTSPTTIGNIVARRGAYRDK